MKIRVKIGEATQEIEAPSLTIKLSGEAGIELDRATEVDIDSTTDGQSPIAVTSTTPLRVVSKGFAIKADREVTITFREPEKDIERLLRPRPGRKGETKDKVLGCLEGGPVTVAEICQRTGLSEGQVYGVLARLKKRGLVTHAKGKWSKAGVVRKDPKEVRDGRILVVGEE